MKKFAGLICAASFLCTLTVICALPPKTAPLATVTTDIYTDQLATGWEDWSWDCSRNFAASTPVHGGQKSISTTYTAGWGGLYLHHAGLSLAGKQYLEFWINGGAGGNQTVMVYAEDASGRSPEQISINGYIEGGSVAANTWRAAKVPLSALKLGGYALTGLVFQNGTASSQGTFFLDDIRLTGDGTSPSPTPFRTPEFGPKAPPYPQSTPIGKVPATWSKKLMLGLGNFEVNWMKNSGVKWQARYQYLVGGVNTQDGWKNWNSPAGEFATLYMNASADAGLTPVFTYYQILHSEPRRYDESLPAYVEKFNNATTMRAYYDDFKLLMDKCKAFGKPVVVHVEPDGWAYMQQTQDDPANYAVQVAGSGHTDATGLPNNAVGFAGMLVRLRDKYAPNVILGLHASMWASKVDVGMNRDPQLDIAAHANLTGTWLNKLGGGWDVIFVDFADRDAAYKQLVANNPWTWWDETNVRLPSFHQAHYYLSRLNQKTRRRLVVWQVPVGNTKKRSCDNTHGHYQDNRVQYYLGAQYGKSHIQELKRAGVIGLLFGRGDGNTTTYEDAEGDGITNPAPISNNKGMATVADDDGGYLRARAAAYQNNPVRVR